MFHRRVKTTCLPWLGTGTRMAARFFRPSVRLRPAPPGDPPGLDRTAGFLARVFVPVAAGEPPERAGDAIVDNGGRRVLPHLGMIAGALGLGG